MLQTVEPVKPIAPYVGGKVKLAARICQIIDQTEHKTYAEPFVGMGGIFFRRRKKPKAEFINDRAGDITNLFRILQRHYRPFMDMLKFQISSRAEFDRLKATDPETLTDLERAARFLYLQRASFGGKVTSRNFGISLDCPARFDLTKLKNMLEAAHGRLAGVTIENLDWLDFINRYDSSETLFYLDPPYFGVENYYGKDLFSRDQFALLADRLSSIKGKFIFSINDVPQIRQLFSNFDIAEAKLSYSVNHEKVTQAAELIISNFPTKKVRA